MKSYVQTTEDALSSRKWWVVNAEDQVVGRLASKIATVLRGKHKATFTPHTDGGDFVVVVNADKIRFTGNKAEQKKYYRHTGYVGGLKEDVAADLLKSNPEQVLFSAVKGMLPKGPLGRQQLSKLKLYAGSEHPHAAQQPAELV
ncbi:MAG: 50S ribosomal protein L13 [bacterium]|nr:50S ribosomal protein L13 [bacterium]